MNYEAKTARKYRAHAEQLRTIADSDMNQQTCRALTKIARDYENMASTLEQIEQSRVLLEPAGPRTARA